MHYSLVTGLDIPGNKVTIANPYGYVEETSLDEFLDRTRLDAWFPFWKRCRTGLITEVLSEVISKLGKRGRLP